MNDPSTGQTRIEFIITAEELTDARDAILESFDAAIASLGSDPEFGGDVGFVVYSPAPPAATLPDELAHAKSVLESRIDRKALETVKGRRFRVRIEQRKSAF